MKTLNLEQVKEHFKYAKEVRCLHDGKVYNLQNITGKGFHSWNDKIWFSDNKMHYDCVVYNPTTNQLAEILTYIFDRGEEVEVSNVVNIWYPRKFISFSLDGQPIIQNVHGNAEQFKRIRKLTPESLLEPQLSELKKVAEANGMTVEVIFKGK